MGVEPVPSAKVSKEPEKDGSVTPSSSRKLSLDEAQSAKLLSETLYRQELNSPQQYLSVLKSFLSGSVETKNEMVEVQPIVDSTRERFLFRQRSLEQKVRNLRGDVIRLEGAPENGELLQEFESFLARIQSLEPPGSQDDSVSSQDEQPITVQSVSLRWSRALRRTMNEAVTSLETLSKHQSALNGLVSGVSDGGDAIHSRELYNESQRKLRALLIRCRSEGKLSL